MVEIDNREIERSPTPVGTDHSDRILSAVRFMTGRLLGGSPLKSVMPEVLKRLGTAAGVESATLLELTLDSSRGITLVPSYSWTIANAQSVFDYAPQGFSPLGTDYEQLFILLKAGDPVVMYANDFPAGLKASLPNEVSAILALPIHVEGDFAGVIALSQRWFKRDWLNSEIDALGTAASVVGAAIQRMRTLPSLAETEIPFRRMVEGAPDVIALVDCKGHIRYLSPSASLLHAYTPNSLLNSTVFDLIHPDELEKCHGMFENALRQPEVIHVVEHKLQDIDRGWVCFESRCRVLSDESGAYGILIVSRDISARKAEEQEIFKLQDRRQKLLNREVHHRIKNSLQGIVGWLRQCALDNPEMRNLIDVAISRVNAISLELQLHGEGKAGAVTIDDILAGICADKALTFPHIPIEVVHSGGLIQTRIVDKEILPIAVIINELVLNALKACRREGHVGSGIRIQEMATDCSVRIEIAGTSGVLPDDFDFPASKGLGTGLQIVKALLPPKGAELQFRLRERGGVAALLTITPPVLDIDRH